jgi:hypothetical protein
LSLVIGECADGGRSANAGALLEMTESKEEN